MDINTPLENHPADGEKIPLEILSLTAEAYPDRRRIRVRFELSNFQAPPNASLTLTNQDLDELAAVNILNIFQQENEVTLHIPANQNPPGLYLIALEVFYLREEPANPDDPGMMELIQSGLVRRQSTLQLP